MSEGLLPKTLGTLSSSHEGESGIPKRALLTLLAIFSTMIVVLSLRPELIETIFTLVSTNFLIIYFLCVAAYTLVSSSMIARIFGLCLTAILGWGLATSGWLLLYPAVLMILGVAISVTSRRAKNLS